MKTRIFHIGFSRNKQGKLVSKFLQSYMKKEYSHTFFEFDTTKIFQDKTIFHSSMSNGVSYWSNIKFEESNIKTHLYEIEMEEQEYRELRAKLHRHAGGKYAFLQNIGIIVVDFFKGLGLNVKNPWRYDENCSEFCFIYFCKMHPEVKEKYNKNTIRPDHIQEILEKYNYKDILNN